MTEEKRTVKGLLLQLKMADNVHEKIACEEEIVHMSEDMGAKLAIAIDGLKHLYRNDASPSGIAHDAELDAILAKLKGANDDT